MSFAKKFSHIKFLDKAMYAIINGSVYALFSIFPTGFLGVSNETYMSW